MRLWLLACPRAEYSRVGPPSRGIALCLALALRHGLAHAQAPAEPTPSPGMPPASSAPEVLPSHDSTSGADAAPANLAAASSDPTSMTFGEIETVTVDADRAPFESRDVIGSVTIIGKDQIANESVNEPLDLLRKLPGVHTEQFNQGIISSDIGVRGFNSQGDVAPLKLLIDGIPSNIHEGVADLKPIFPLDIERIEIVRGTADPRYGLYAVAGSLHVDTRQGGNGNLFRGIAGSFDTFEAQATSAFENDRVSQNLFGGFRYSDGYRDHSELQKYALSGKCMRDRLS